MLLARKRNRRTRLGHSVMLPLCRQVTRWAITLAAVFFLGIFIGDLHIHLIQTCLERKPGRKLPSFEAKSEIPVLFTRNFPDRVATAGEEEDSWTSVENVKRIVLFGDVWTKFDKWKKSDWEKCPVHRCSISTNINMATLSEAIVFNSAEMPTSRQIAKFKSMRTETSKNTKFVFMSGLNPAETFFQPEIYDGFFDVTITYKSNSDIRIPYWPNDGILPSMLRPKEPVKVISEEELHRYQEQNAHYFSQVSKDEYLIYVLPQCDSNLLANIYASRLRWEGTFTIMSGEKCNVTKLGFPSIEAFPCKNMYSDACSKFLEGFKFVLLPESNLCKGYLQRAYWYALRAWEAVPILWGVETGSSLAIPGSYIDALQYEYVSPPFKMSYNSEGGEYATYMLWKEEKRLEHFYWQCELCAKLHSDEFKARKPLVNFSKFWDKDSNCGNRTTLYRKAKDQLIRTRAIVP